MSKRYKVALAFVCSLLLIAATLSSALAAGPKPGSISPNSINPPPQPCLHATINKVTYNSSATFLGEISYVCGETVSGNLKFSASLLCMGETSADPTHYQNFNLVKNQFYAWSYNEVGLCYTCTDHVVTSAPPFYITGKIFASGIADPDGFMALSNTATVTANPSNSGTRGESC